MAYDIIGDVHGHALELRALLDKMGYRETRGAYRHPSRTAIFVGDLIDRGSANIDAATVARQMVEEGTARIVMGNHEFNAIAFHTEDPERPGEFLRPHSCKNVKQHLATLQEFKARPDRKQPVAGLVSHPARVSRSSRHTRGACVLGSTKPCGAKAASQPR